MPEISKLEMKCSKLSAVSGDRDAPRSVIAGVTAGIQKSHTYFWHLGHSAVCIATWQPGSSLPIAAQHDQRAARVAVAGCHAPL